jgi:hypothetical protein
VHFTCPVCGYPCLDRETYTQSGGASDEICPSCGIQFGYDDEAGGDWKRRRDIYLQWRRAWIAAGMPWRGVGIPAPRGWNPAEQVSHVS